MFPEGLKLHNQAPRVTTSLDLQIRNVLSLVQALWTALKEPGQSLHTPSRTLALTHRYLLCVVAGQRCGMESRKGHVAAWEAEAGRENDGACRCVWSPSGFIFTVLYQVDLNSQVFKPLVY